MKSVHIGGRDRLGCSNCEFVYWNNPLPVTATLIPHNDGLVLVKRKFEPFVGWWCLPGGFMESAEHPEESAIREVYEETGLTVEIDRLLGAHSPGRGINVLILFYLAKHNSGILQAGDDAEEVQTFKISDLPEQIAFDLHRQMISDFFK
jgi:ADP-ribose pyrophosphatase YjhB (NUDIX family)